MSAESNKRIARNTLLLYVRMFFTMAVGFYTSRVVLGALGVVDYGIYNVVGGIVGTLSVLNGAMAGSTQRWITFALGRGDVDYLKQVFGVGLTAQLIVAVVVALLVETVGLWYLYNCAVIPLERLSSAFIVFQISMLTMLISIVIVPFNGAIIAHERMGMFAFFSITDVVMKLIVCLALSVTSSDRLLVYASLLFIGVVINSVWMVIYCHRAFAEARFRFRWDGSLYKEMGGLAFWTVSGNLAYVGYSQGVTLLINLFFGPAMNAAAGVAAQANNIAMQFCGNFQVALNPQITKSYAKHDYAEMHGLICRSAKFSFFLALLFAVPMFYEAPFLLRLWLGDVPEHAPMFMRLGVFIVLLSVIRNPLTTAAMANGHLRNYQFVVNGILLLVCPLLYFAYKLGAMPEISSVIFAFVLLSAIIASAFLLENMVGLGFKCFVHSVLWVALRVGLLCWFISGVVWISMSEGWERFIVLCAVSLLGSLSVIYCVGLSKEERAYLKSVACGLWQRYCR